MTTYCFDLDGTLCTNTYGDYESAEPFLWAIARVNALHDAGHRILVFTARGSSTGIDWSQRTRAQLDAWGVHFDELRLGKPEADVFVDDRALGWDVWRWGQPALIPDSSVRDERRRAAMAHGILGFPGQFALGTIEVGRTFCGRALWLGDHLDALLDGQALEDRATVLEQLREAIEPPGGTLGDPGEVIFTLHRAAPPHPAYLDVRHEPAPVAVSCRPWAQAAAALTRHRPSAGWSGVRALVVGETTISGALDGDVTARRVADAAGAAGLRLADRTGPTGAGGEPVLVCAPFPLLVPDDGSPGPATRRLAAAVAAVTGVDPLQELDAR